ncbi:uncharacterized protein LOC144905876 [Branchiostoma floridae x Branchiostoma belcheri]
MWRAGRRRRQRQGFQGVVLPLRILEDNGISRTVRSVYRQDEPQVSSAAPTTTLQPTADNNDITSSCQQSADEPVPDVSRHQQKKEQEKEAWADRRDDLIQTGMKLATPPTDFCYYCEQRVTSPMLYCRDCGPLGIYCLTCFEMFHISPSLHRPLEWKGGCFQPYMKRKTLSLPCHYSCFGTIDTRSMRIFDQTGRVQYVDVVLCSCEPELSTLLQLGLWGATPTKPQTAFSVELLEWLCVLSMESQVSVEAFCQAVRWKNDLTRDEKNTLHRALSGECIAEYQHYRDRMKTMRDLSPLLDDDTGCPACTKADGELIVAIDANFGLVRKASSGVSAAPPLHGTTMFLEDSEVKEFLDMYHDEEKPPEDCSNFKAGNCLRSKAQQKKLDITGVFGGVCRHEVPQKFLNMFHGERFGYPVYLIKHLLDEASARNVRLKVIYDVACSLTAHIANTRQDALRQELKLAMEAGRLSLAVDVFHSYGHQSSCQVKLSTRRLSGYGLTDGEGSERLWSALRPFARMTKEMSPDHRLDKLTDALRHYSMRKVVDIDASLVLKLDKAIKAEKIAEDNLQQAKSDAGGTFSDEDVEAWREMEKVVMGKTQPPPTSSPKWKKLYVANLIKYKELGEKILQCQEDSTLAVHHAAFVKLEASLKAVEDKHKIHRWCCTDEQYISALKDLDEEERSRHLGEMRSASYKRAFLISLKQRYPDGQAIALKLSKQLTASSKKLAKAIQAYNGIQWEPQSAQFPSTVAFEHASDPAWDMYQTLDTSMGEPGLPYSVKRRAIDAVSLRERASEEQEMVKAEMERVMQHLLDQHHITDHEIRRCRENYNTAGQAVLTQHIVRIEQRLERFFHHFKQHIPTLPEPPSSHIEQRSHSLESDSSTSPFDNVSDEEEGDSTDEEEGEFIVDEGGYSTDTYPSDMEVEAWG